MEFERTLCQDAALYFIPWLIDRKSEQNTFVKPRAMFRKGIRGAAPLCLFWKHVRKERGLSRTLTKDDCDPRLWTWGTSYSKQDPATFLERRESSLDKIHQGFLRQGKMTSDSRLVPGATGTTVRAAASRRVALGRFEDRVKVYWDNQSIQITKNGTFRIYIDRSQAGLKIGTTQKLFSRVQDIKKDVTIYFYHHGIKLKQGEEILSRVESGTGLRSNVTA